MMMNFLMFYGLKVLLREYGRNVDIGLLTIRQDKSMSKHKPLLQEQILFLLKMEKECLVLQELN